MNKFILEGSYHSGLYGNGLQGERVEQTWKQTFGGGSQDDLDLGCGGTGGDKWSYWGLTLEVDLTNLLVD